MVVIEESYSLFMVFYYSQLLFWKIDFSSVTLMFVMHGVSSKLTPAYYKPSMIILDILAISVLVFLSLRNTTYAAFSNGLTSKT